MAQVLAMQPESEKEAQQISASEADSLSLDERNEKEVLQHPNEVTASANEGVKKAEAAALMWSQTTVYLIYAW